MTSGALRYRRDIDGLRAVAIIPVVLYHAFPRAFPGGYVGVDVFFVISGFLISGIILKAVDGGRFSFTDFYVRRVCRIFPALALVLLVTLAASWLLLFASEFRQLGKHVAAGAGFVSNLALWRESGYFDTVAERKPLLHLWSLGIEEQYYIVWPVMVLMAWRWRHRFLGLVLVVMATSFAINLRWVDAKPSYAFYLPVARVWELMVGSGLAYAQLRYGARMSQLSSRAWAKGLPVVGAGMILAAWVLLSKESSFPGWWALLPTLGTALIVGFGESSFLGRQVLGHPWVVYVGLISYPLYLWHWPVLTLGRLAGALSSPWAVGGAVMLAVGLASATYHWIEGPVRSSQQRGKLALVLTLAMLVIGGGGWLVGHYVKPLHSTPDVERIMAAAGEWDYPGRMDTITEGALRLRAQGPGEGAALLVIGDSNAEQYYPRFEAELSRMGWPRRLFFATVGGCPPIPGVTERHHPRCVPFMKETELVAHRPEVDRIVVASLWVKYFDGEEEYYLANSRRPIRVGSEGYLEALGRLEEMIRGWVGTGKRVYLIANVPTDEALDPWSLVDRDLWRSPYVRIRTAGVDRSKVEARTGRIHEDLAKVAAATGATWIEPMAELCTTAWCPATAPDGTPMYKDAAHLRPAYVRSHGAFLDVTLR